MGTACCRDGRRVLDSLQYKRVEQLDLSTSMDCVYVFGLMFRYPCANIINVLNVFSINESIV